MSRPSYKELYLKEKMKSKFSYRVLKNIVDMLNGIGIETEIEKGKYTFRNVAILKAHNPSNNLYACLEMDEDLLEEEIKFC